MNDCIFCKIINGELPSKTIHEDEIVKVIMSIDPITNGHLLVLPKEHCVNILDVKEDFLIHSHKLIRDTLYPLLKEKLNCEGLTLAENNFLGQEIRHFHIHLVPRYQNDQADFVGNKDMLKSLDNIFSDLTK